jgi:nucleotide-binding universal stress UspA family protein
MSLRTRVGDMYERVLIPTDGSVGTRGAVERAVDLASSCDAELHALYVVDAPVGADATAAETLDALEQAGREAIDEVIRHAEAAEVKTIEGVVARGVPHRAILDYVDEHDVDVVVMGTHGRTGLDRYLLGSVTEKVVRLSDAPVMTVPMPADAWEDAS